MTLATLAAIEQQLICPSCRCTVHAEAGRYQCENSGCRYAGETHFPVVHGQPVLIDFENSILDEVEVTKTAAASTVQRSQNPWRKWFKNTFFKTKSIAIARQNAERLHQQLKQQADRPRILVIGGGGRGIGTDLFYDDEDIELIGFDIYATPLTQFVADGHRIPLADGSVDAVWVQYVLEHVLDPWQVVSEAHRVLKPNGLVYAETPFMQQVHEGPYDFTRFTPSGHRWLFRNYTELDAGVVMGPGLQLLWTIDHVSRSLFGSVRVAKLIKSLFFWVRYLDTFSGSGPARDNASAVYFLGQRSAQSLKPKEIVPYYKNAA